MLLRELGIARRLTLPHGERLQQYQCATLRAGEAVMEARFGFAKRTAAWALDMSVRNLERHVARGLLSVCRYGWHLKIREGFHNG